MKNCPHCGEPLVEGATICPNCGKVPDPSPEKQTRNKKSWLLAGGIVAALLILVGVVVFLSSRGGGGAPSDQFVSYQKSQLVEYPLTKVDAFSQKVESGAFSTDLTVKASMEGVPQVNDLLRALTLNLKLDVSQKHSLVNADLNVMGTPVFTGAVVYEEDRLGFQFPELDPGYYSVNLATLAERAAAMGETKLMAATTMKLPLTELSRLFERYVGVVLTVVNQDNVTLQEGETVALPHLDAKPEGLVLVFQPTGKDVEQMILRIADTMEKDEELRALLEKYSKDEMVLALVDSINYALADELRAYTPDVYDRAVQAVRDQAVTLGEKVEELGLRWSLGVTENEVCLQRIELTGLGLDMGLEKNADGVVLYADSEEEGKMGYMRQLLEYRKSEEGFHIRLSDAVQDFMRLDYRRPEGEVATSALGVPYGDYRFHTSMNSLYHMNVVAADEGGTDHILEFPLGDIAVGTIRIHSTDAPSTAQAPAGTAVDVTDYSPAEIGGLLGGMAGEFDALVKELTPVWYQ